MRNFASAVALFVAFAIVPTTVVANDSELVSRWDGFNGSYADVWAEGDYAYVAHFGHAGAPFGVAEGAPDATRFMGEARYRPLQYAVSVYRPLRVQDQLSIRRMKEVAIGRVRLSLFLLESLYQM